MLQAKIEFLTESKEMANNQIEQLEFKVKELQTSCNQFEVENETLKTENKLKESMWTEKETILKSQIEQADQNMADLRNQIANGSTAGMNIAELMAKLAIQQKRNSTLQIELKTAQLELSAKTQTDSGKTKLIELLDKKIEQLQGQNKHMLGQIENVTSDRMRDVEGSKSTHLLIEQTMDRLKRADAINSKLQQANEQLRNMLESMEEKTTKISTMAKEKLTLYKAENTKLQLTVQSLSLQLAKIKSQLPKGLPTASGEEPVTTDAGGAESAAAAEAIAVALTEAQKSIHSWKNKYDEVYSELEEMKAQSERSSSSSSSSAVNSTSQLDESSTKLAQLEKVKAITNKALVKSREEVKRALIDKMNVDEEIMLVDARQIEVKGRHEELLKQLSLTEASVRKLEYEIASVTEVVEAAEAQKEGAEAPGGDDSPLILRVKHFIKGKIKLKNDVEALIIENIALKKDLENKVKKLNTEIHDSKVDDTLLETKSDMKDEGSKIVQMQHEIDEQRAKIGMDTNKTNIDSLETKLAEYKKQNKRLMDEKLGLQNACRDVENDKHMVAQKLKEDFLHQIESKDAEIAKLQNRLQELAAELEVDLTKIAVTENTSSNLESKLVEYQQRNKALMAEKIAYETSCRGRDTFKLKETESKLKSLLIQMKTKDLEITALRNKMKMQNSMIELESKKANKIHGQLDCEHKEAESLQEQMSLQLQAKDIEMSDLKKELREQKIKHDVEAKKTSKIEVLESKYSEAQKRNATLIKDKVAIENICRELEINLKSTRRNYKTHRASEAEAHKLATNTLKYQISEYRKMNETLMEEKIIIDNNCQKLKEELLLQNVARDREIKKLKNLILEKNVEIEVMTNKTLQVEGLKSKLSEYLKKNAFLAEEKASLDSKIAFLLKEKDSSENKYQQLETTIRHKAEKQDEEIVLIVKRKDSEIVQLKQEILNQNAKLEVEANAANNIEDLTSKLAEYQNKNETLLQEKVSLENMLHDFEPAKEEESQSYENLLQLIKSKDSEIVLLQNKILEKNTKNGVEANTSIETEDLKSKLVEYQKNNEMLLQEKASLENMCHDFEMTKQKEQKEARLNLITEKDSEITQLQNEILKLKEKIVVEATNADKVEDLEFKLSEYQTKNKTLMEEKVTFENNFKELGSKNQLEMESHHEELFQQINEKDHEISQLQTEIFELKKKIVVESINTAKVEGLECKLSEYQTKNKTLKEEKVALESRVRDSESKKQLEMASHQEELFKQIKEKDREISALHTKIFEQKVNLEVEVNKSSHADQLVFKLEEVKMKNEVLIKDKSGLENTCRDLETSLQTTREKTIQSQEDDFMLEIHSKDIEIIQLQNEILDERAKTEAEAKKTNEVDNIKSNLAKYEEQNKILVEEKVQLEAMCKDSETKQLQAEKVNEGLQMQMQSKINELKILQDEIVDQRVKVEMAGNTSDASKIASCNLESKLSEYENRIKSLMEEKEIWENYILEQKVKIEIAENESDASKIAAFNLESKLLECENRIKSLMQEKDSLETNYTDLESSKQEENGRQEKLLQIQIEERDGEICNLHTKILEQKEKFEAEATKAIKIEECKTQLVEYQNKYEVVFEDNAAAQRMCQDMESTDKLKERQIEELLQRINAKDNELLGLQNEVLQYKSKVEAKKAIEDDEAKLASEGLESKLAEYRKRYETLMEEKVVLECKCREIEIKLKTTKQTLKKADKENKKLLAERENLRKDIENLHGEVHSLTKENENINTEMEQLESMIMKSVEGKLSALQNNLEREQKGRKKLESDVEQLRAKHRSNEALLEQHQMKKRNVEIEFHRQIKDKQEQLICWRNENALLKNKIGALTNQYDDASRGEVAQLEELKMDIDLLKCDLQSANDNLEVVRSSVANTEQLLMSALIEMGSVDPSYLNEESCLKGLAIAMIKSQQNVKVQMTEKCQELDTALAKVECDMKTIKTLEMAAIVNTAEQDHLTELHKNATIELKKLKENLGNAHYLKDELESRLENMTETSSSSVTQWEHEKATLKKSIENLTEETYEKSKTISLQQKKLEDQENQLSDALLKRDQLQSSLEDLQQIDDMAHSALEAQKEILISNIADLSDLAEENLSDVSILKQALDEKESEILAAEVTRKELEAKITALQKNVSTSKEDWLEEKEGISDHIADLTKAASKNVASMVSMKQKLEKQEAVLTKVWTAQCALESKISELRQASAETAAHSKSEKESLIKEIDSLNDFIESKDEEIEVLKEMMSKYELETKNLMKENGESKNLQLQQKESEVLSLMEALSAQEKQLSREEALKQEISGLRFELSSQQMEHQKALQGLEGHALSVQDLVRKLSTQESLIEMLEKDLESLKRERLLEKNRMLNELADLRQSLCGRDDECKLLNCELKRTSMLLDEERVICERLRKELNEIRARFDHELDNSRQETELLKTDTQVLKEQLIKVVKDKAELWEKTDKLEYMQRLTVSGSWTEETEALQCTTCSTVFSFMIRKHHCRLCRRSFCYSCCNHWVKVPDSNKKARICLDCALHHKSEMIRDSDMDEDTEETSNSTDTTQPKSINDGLQSENTEVSDDITVSEVSEEDKDPVSQLQEDDVKDEFQAMNRDIFGASPAYVAAEEGPLQAIAASKDRPPSSQSLKQNKSQSETIEQSDEDITTEEEISQSLHESILETGSLTFSSPIITVDQIASGKLYETPDLYVSAGKAYVVPIFIDSPGVILCWTFTTEPKGIHFSVTFRKDALTSNDLAEILIPLCPCNSHRTAIQGELIAVQPGLYTLIFDNCSSRFTSKKLDYKLYVRRPEMDD